MFYKFLAERAALVRVFDGFFVADAGKADALDDDTNSLVVEIGHYDCLRLSASSQLYMENQRG